MNERVLRTRVEKGLGDTVGRVVLANQLELVDTRIHSREFRARRDVLEIHHMDVGKRQNR